MGGLHVRCRVANDKLRDRMGLECMSVVMQRGRLRWFGHVEQMGEGTSNWMNEEGQECEC